MIDQAPAWQEVTDEHGEVTDDRVPKDLVYDEESYRRWLGCVQIAETMTGHALADGYLDPETSYLATYFFKSPLPTGGEPTEISEAAFQGHGQQSFDPNQWRNRLGRWIDMPDRLPHAPRSPGLPKPPQVPPLKLNPGVPEPEITPKQIRDAGLDKPPEKGPKALEILGEAEDTFELYGPEEPSPDPKFPEYATDRAANHDALIAAELENKTAPEGDPHALFTGGGPASGKTTVLRANRDLLAPAEAHTVHIDVDEIQSRMKNFNMPEYEAMRLTKDHYAAAAVHREAGDIAAKLVQAALDKGLNVIIDGTGDSDPGEFSQQLLDMKDKGYTVDVLYVNRSTDLSEAANIKRAEDTGRFVPLPVLRDQHIKVSKNFRDEISKMAWLNSLMVIDAGAGITAMLDDQGEMHILDGERYAAFVAKADETPPDKKALDKFEDSPLAEGAASEDADEPVVEVPVTEWVIQLPHDSSEWLGRRKKPW